MQTADRHEMTSPIQYDNVPISEIVVCTNTTLPSRMVVTWPSLHTPIIPRLNEALPITLSLLQTQRQQIELLLFWLQLLHVMAVIASGRIHLYFSTDQRLPRVALTL